jgi:RNA polymerase sigma-70 factor (ECF subfamily)
VLSADLLIAELPGLYRFAMSLVRDEARAADLVQDTMVRALEKGDQWRQDAGPGAWLRTILRNLAFDHARKSTREVVVEAVEDDWRRDEYTVSPEAVVVRASDRAELEDALVRLPFMYRVAVLLHDVEGMTVREIAEVEQIGLPAAKQRLRRGRMMLVSALAEGHDRRHRLEGVPMNCWDARQHVSDYLDGVLAPEIGATVEAHLETCPTCPPLYASLVGVRDVIGGLRDPDTVIPPWVEDRVRRALSL